MTVSVCLSVCLTDRTVFHVPCEISVLYDCLTVCPVVGQGGGSGSLSRTGTLQTRSVTASQLATDSPARTNGGSLTREGQ